MHSALSIGCYHDQTFAGDAIGVGAVHIGVNTGGFQVIEVKLAEVIIGDLACVIR